MDKKIAGLLGAAAAVTTVTGAQAGPAQPAPLAAPASYRELLEPIQNAAALLKADDEARDYMSSTAPIEKVQWHHHHHHHHHHHSGFYPGAVIGGVVGGLLAPPPPCYWTYGRPVWNGYAWVRPRIQVCR